MKRYILLIPLLILFGIGSAQPVNRINSFFNDSLKGKWIFYIMRANEVVGAYDTTNRNKDYVIFKAINENNFVSYETNSNNVVKTGLAKLYLPDSTDDDIIIRNRWTLDNIFYKKGPKIIISIGSGGLNRLWLTPAYGIISSTSEYYRDTIYTNVSGLKIPGRITLFPNPTDGELVIKNECPEMIAISIFDLNGKKVKELSLAPVEERKIDLSALNSGAYIFRYRSKSIDGERLIIKTKK